MAAWSSEKIASWSPMPPMVSSVFLATPPSSPFIWRKLFSRSLTVLLDLARSFSSLALVAWSSLAPALAVWSSSLRSPRHFSRRLISLVKLSLSSCTALVFFAASSSTVSANVL